MRILPLVFSLVLLAVASACHSSTETQAAAETSPLPLAGTECAACGMTVAEQPAPRGQVVHRDGTHAFFCSVADMVTYLESPSPHGAALGTFVEVLPLGTDPAETDMSQYPWTDAAQASFVVGEFERPVMGRPILTFEVESDAQEAAARLDGSVIPWDALPSHTH